MESWIKAVGGCYKVDDAASQDFKFDILNGKADVRAKRVAHGQDMAAFAWSGSESDFLIAAGAALPAAEDELQDKLEGLLEQLLSDAEAELFAARQIIVDDMFGLEVCGAVRFDPEEPESVFYAVYLSDGIDGYSLSGFGSGEPEIVFDELAGVARTFYRKPAPAVRLKGKTFGAVFDALRKLALDTIPNTDADWMIANATFEIKEGKALSKPSVILITKNGSEQLDSEDVYPDKDFSIELTEFTALLPGVFDMTGFTVTNFKDGRYGVTYYPVDEIEPDEHHHHDEDYGCGDDEKEIPELEPTLKEFGDAMSESFDADWKHGMGLITTDGDFFSLAVYFSNGASFIAPEIPEKLDEKLSNMINDLGETLEEGFSGWNALGFAFERSEDSAGTDENSVRYEIFNFDTFIDAADEEHDEEDEYLLPATDLFYEELNESGICISAVTFKIAVSTDGLFVIEPATASTPEGLIRIQSFDNMLPKIFSIVEDVFDKFEDSNTISATVFPSGKVGFTVDYTDTPDIINRQNLSELLKEAGLNKYKDNIVNLVRDEILALVYEVDVEESLQRGVSKTGGTPDLPAGADWPKTDPEDKPMSFIAQVNLAEVAPFDKEGLLPKKGLLSFFYAKEGEENKCKVIYNAADDLELAMPFEDIEYVDEFLPARLRFIPSVSLPDLDDNTELLKFENEEDGEAYYDISNHVGKTKIFGYADYLESDMEQTYERKAVLLFQVASLDECDMEWGDSGALYFWIFEDDLKAGRFNKCWCVIQSY